MVSAGEIRWVKCTKCYKVLEVDPVRTPSTAGLGQERVPHTGNEDARIYLRRHLHGLRQNCPADIYLTCKGPPCLTPWKAPDLPNLLDSDCGVDCGHEHDLCEKSQKFLPEAILREEELELIPKKEEKD